VHIVRVRHLFYPDMPRDYFYELSAQQVKNGHEIDVLTWKKDGGFSEERMAEGFVVHRLPGLNFRVKGIVQEYPYLPSLPAEIETLKPEVVHVESHLFLTAFQAIMKAKRLRLPCVVTVHGVFAERGRIANFAQYAYLRSLGLKILQGADRVVCLTQSDAAEIEKYGCSSEKIRLVPNAVDTQLFKPCKEVEDNLVVWVGRFVPEKGVEYLIKATKTVSDKFSSAKFLLIGYGPLKAKIIEMAHAYGLIGKFVTFAGPLSRGEIAQILSKATVFVFPSLKEGLPLSVLEALACGNPVVGSNIPGISDIVTHGQNGLLVSPRNPDALANAILTLLEDENLRRRSSQNARRLIVEKYSWNIVLNKIEEVYREAIKEIR
jgi:glycosyltransferase involved in cell wall biosynthesis